MKKFLAVYVVAILTIALGLTSAKAGTIAHWTFENDGAVGSNPSTVVDSVQGLVGTTIGGPTIVGNSPSGFGNKALSFDGINDTVRVSSGSTGPLALTGDFTIELGIRSAQTTGLGFGIFYGDPQGGLDPYYIYVDSSGNVLFQIYNGGGVGPGGSNSVSTGPGAIQLGDLTHVAAVFDEDAGGNTLSIYIDQVLAASTNIGTNSPFYGDTTSDFWMGSVHNDGLYYRGDLTDVRISDMALAPAEMFPVPEPGMVAIFGMGLLGLAMVRRKRA